VGPLPRVVGLGEAPGQPGHELRGGRTQTASDLHDTPGVGVGVERCQQVGEGS
jgi:hypothetical protein